MFYLDELTYDENMTVNEGMIAVQQAQNNFDICCDEKYNLYGESVGAIFAGIMAMAKSAIIFILKALAGFKIAVVAIIGVIIAKFIKDGLKGNKADIHGGGGGGGGATFSGKLDTLGIPREPAKLDTIKRMSKRVLESIKKNGKMNDGDMFIKTAKKLKPITSNYNILMDDKGMEDVIAEAFKSFRINIDKTSKGAFVIPKDIAQVAVDMVTNNIVNDMAFDGTKYSDILNKYPLYELEDRSGLVDLYDDFEKLVGEGFDVHVFMADSIANVHTIMALAMSLQIEPVVRRKLGELLKDRKPNDKVTDEEMKSLVTELINKDYVDFFNIFPPKFKKSFTEAISSGDKNGEIFKKAMDEIINYKFDAFSAVLKENDGIDKLARMFEKVKYNSLKSVDAVKWISFAQINSMSDSENAVYDVEFSDNTFREYSILRACQSKIDEYKLDIKAISAALDNLRKSGEQVKKHIEDGDTSQDTANITAMKENFKIAIGDSINLTKYVSKIIEIISNAAKNAKNPIYNKIHEDLSYAIQTIYFLSINEGSFKSYNG